MGPCSFCPRPAEQGVWLRRWREAARAPGPGRAGEVRDAQVRLCARHLRAAVVEQRPLRRDGWLYG